MGLNGGGMLGEGEEEIMGETPPDNGGEGRRGAGKGCCVGCGRCVGG